MQNKILVKEIFESIQGEGIYSGVNQLFIRFTRCNLNCAYCDTDFKSDLKEYTAQELAFIANSYKNIHSISLTGGEPLMEADFLEEFLPLINSRIYLETNGTLTENLKRIINNIDIISMDIKLPSCTKGKDLFNEHEEFIKAAKGKELFLKVVFDTNITGDEILKCCKLAQEYSLPLVLQPKMTNGSLELNTEFINKIFKVFIMIYPETRLMVQMHKFLNLK